jgi:hypothetical protein
MNTVIEGVLSEQVRRFYPQYTEYVKLQLSNGTVVDVLTWKREEFIQITMRMTQYAIAKQRNAELESQKWMNRTRLLEREIVSLRRQLATPPPPPPPQIIIHERVIVEKNIDNTTTSVPDHGFVQMNETTIRQVWNAINEEIRAREALAKRLIAQEQKFGLFLRQMMDALQKS